MNRYRCIDEYISTIQLTNKFLQGEQDVAESICDSLGTDGCDRRWVEPYFMTGVTDLTEDYYDGFSFSWNGIRSPRDNTDLEEE